ncbi:2441_t:CDS:1, partial [Dentiscutata heterogama]
ACPHAIVGDYALKTIPTVLNSLLSEPRVFAVLTIVEDVA